MKKEYKYPQMQVEEIYLSTSICSTQSGTEGGNNTGDASYDPWSAPARILYM